MFGASEGTSKYNKLAGTAGPRNAPYMTRNTSLELGVKHRRCEWAERWCGPQEGHSRDLPMQRCTFQGFC